MNSRYQDALALARHYRSFDLFVTFACNPNWVEIQQELLSGQTPADCPDFGRSNVSVVQNKDG
jgi:hypothetical protein